LQWQIGRINKFSDENSNGLYMQGRNIYLSLLIMINTQIHDKNILVNIVFALFLYIFVLICVNGKMKAKLYFWSLNYLGNVFELKLTEMTKLCNREKLRNQNKSNFN